MPAPKEAVSLCPGGMRIKELLARGKSFPSPSGEFILPKMGTTVYCVQALEEVMSFFCLPPRAALSQGTGQNELLL